MQPADARWLLAQPEALRRALAEVPGPGWVVWSDGSHGDVLDFAPAWRVMETTAWAPCDPCAILKYTTGQVYFNATCYPHGLGYGIKFNSDKGTYSAWGHLPGLFDGPTPFRAAVALLAAVLDVEIVGVSDVG